MRQGAQGWCIEMSLRDGMGREVERRVRMGNTGTAMYPMVFYGKNQHNIVK